MTAAQAANTNEEVAAQGSELLNNAEHNEQVPVADPRILDLETALKRMGGNRKLYITAAEQFISELSNWLSGSGRVDTSENKETARRRLHSLKGVAATLGLRPLALEMARLEMFNMTANASEKPTLVNDETTALVHDAIAEMQRLLPLLQEDANPGHALSAIPDDKLVSLLQTELLPLLQADDMEALAVFARLRADLSLVDARMFEPLEAALQDLDFVKALEICRAFELHSGGKASDVA